MWKWKRKEKKFVDERILKESNALAAKLYYATTILTILTLATKVICKLPVYVYALDLIVLLAGIGYICVCELRKGILFMKEKDEALKNIHQEILAKAWNIEFSIVIFGELVFLFVAGKYFFWVLSYLVVWFVPALVYTIAAIKNGWLIWGSKRREKDGKKYFKKRVVIGALFYGVFMGFPMLFKGGTFHPEGFLWILGMAAGWGIPFYLIFMLMMKVAEKRADKKLEEKELQIEE